MGEEIRANDRRCYIRHDESPWKLSSETEIWLQVGGTEGCDDGSVCGEKFVLLFPACSATVASRKDADIGTGVDQEASFTLPVGEKEAARPGAAIVGRHQRLPFSFSSLNEHGSLHFRAFSPNRW